jgi:hypothetical protein
MFISHSVEWRAAVRQEGHVEQTSGIHSIPVKEKMTRYLQFFMHPSEFWPLFWEMVSAKGLYVIFVRLGPNRKLQIVDIPNTTVMSDGLAPEWIFVATVRPEINTLDANDLHTAEWGWVQIDVPRAKDGVLLLSTLAGKSELYDAISNQKIVNNDVTKIFDRVARFLKKRLMRPVWARNVIDDKAQRYNQIWYSSGAADWHRSGGVLQQEGVDNVVFTIQG